MTEVDLDRSLLVPLSWDSTHFGFPVARLERVSDDSLAFDLLKQARRRSIVMVYWQKDSGNEARADLIGLVAVDAAARGKRIGSALMAAAHEWLAERELHQCRVVTQRDNVPACRLYERCGYQCVGVVPVYHFWPLGAGAIQL